MFWLFKFRWTHNTCSKFQGVTFRILFLGRKSRSFLLINAFKFWKTLMRPLDIKWTKVSFTVVLFLHMQMQELEHIIYRKEIYHKKKNIYIYIYRKEAHVSALPTLAWVPFDLAHISNLCRPWKLFEILFYFFNFFKLNNWGSDLNLCVYVRNTQSIKSKLQKWKILT